MMEMDGKKEEIGEGERNEVRCWDIGWFLIVKMNKMVGDLILGE